ncbi:unnamed protein product [Polarella glacialis]|uniref:Secreted protein n=1 Tax=Polarella glacialis TaxID=89957 RepID=A0A813DIH9_POLGL|nr:unnamed protein product [Polarella glacialis]
MFLNIAIALFAVLWTFASWPFPHTKDDRHRVLAADEIYAAYAKPLCAVPHPALSNEIVECFKGLARPGNTRSLTQASYTVGVHAPAHVQRLGGLKHVKPGEKSWHASGSNLAFSLNVHKFPRQECPQGLQHTLKRCFTAPMSAGSGGL